MSIYGNLKGQWDVNTRGRTDNVLYEHVNGVASTLGGTTSLDTSGNFDGINFNGTTGYSRSALPAGLSSTFADSDYTMAVRFKMDTTNPAAYQVFMGAYDSADSQTRAEIGSEITTGDLLASHTLQSVATPWFAHTDVQVDDGAEHVAVIRRVGNVFSLWSDGVKVDEDTVAAGALGTLNRITFGTQDDVSPSLWFDGTVEWGAIWSDDLSDTDIARLHAVENPFHSFITYLTGVTQTGTRDPSGDLTLTFTRATGDTGDTHTLFFAVSKEGTSTLNSSAVTFDGSAAQVKPLTNSEQAQEPNWIQWFQVDEVTSGSHTITVGNSGGTDLSKAIIGVTIASRSGYRTIAFDTLSAKATGISGTAVTVTPTIEADDIILAACSEGNQATHTWSGTGTFAEFDDRSQLSASTSGARQAFSTSGSKTVTCTSSITINRLAVTAIVVREVGTFTPPVSVLPNSPFRGLAGGF